MGSAIFERLDCAGAIKATRAAAGPWNPDSCHGGAPAALLAKAIMDREARTAMSLARLTVDILGPVPVGEPLRLETEVVREGRTVQLVEARLWANDVRVAQASGLKLGGARSAVGPALHQAPDQTRHAPMPGGFSGAFTIVPELGGFGGAGPADVWFRLDTPVVRGTTPGLIERAVAAADFGSGIAHELPFEDWLFPSLDLTVGFDRPPVGDWTRVQSRWLTKDPPGTVCATILHDLHGPFAHAIQSLLIQARDNR